MDNTMFRAEIERMPGSVPDPLPEGGLWKVMIYEHDRFVRTDRDNIPYSVAQELAEKFNFEFGSKRRSKAAS